MLAPEELIIWVAGSAIEAMAADGFTWAPAETGGVLLGYWIDTREVVVTSASVGGPQGVHDPRGFQPDASHQAQQIAEMYEASGRLHTYLGDWHTHPRGGMALSRTDRRTMRRIGRSREARCSTPLMLLLASGDEWRLGAWSGQRGRQGRLLPVRATVTRYDS